MGYSIKNAAGVVIGKGERKDRPIKGKKDNTTIKQATTTAGGTDVKHAQAYIQEPKKQGGALVFDKKGNPVMTKTFKDIVVDNKATRILYAISKDGTYRTIEKGSKVSLGKNEKLSTKLPATRTVRNAPLGKQLTPTTPKSRESLIKKIQEKDKSLKDLITKRDALTKDDTIKKGIKNERIRILNNSIETQTRQLKNLTNKASNSKSPLTVQSGFTKAPPLLTANKGAKANTPTTNSGGKGKGKGKGKSTLVKNPATSTAPSERQALKGNYKISAKELTDRIAKLDTKKANKILTPKEQTKYDDYKKQLALINQA